MSEYIEVGQSLQFTDPNTPTRVGEIVENVSDIYNIPSPRLGMQVFVKSEKKSFVITSLKSKVIGGVDVPEAAVEAFELVGAKAITWNNDTDPSNMNDFVVAGVYDIKGEHKRVDDNLPILNTGGGHTFNSRLTVLDSSITGSGKNDDKCITQVLSFSNRLGQGEMYIRTGKGSSLDNLSWEKWSTLQRNVNVDTVTSLDHLIDNGIYSGVYVKNAAEVETFVMVVINNYAAASQKEIPKSVSQFKYSVSLGGSFAKYETRVGGGNPVSFPYAWEILNKHEITSMISAEIKKVTDGVDPEKIDSIKDLVNWVNEHGNTVEGLLAAINANTAAITAERTRAIGQEGLLNNAIAEEKTRAERAENALDDKIAAEADRAKEAENELANAITEESKVTDKKIANEIEKIKDGDTIAGQAREIHSRNGKTVTDSFLVRTTAGSGTIGDGVASLKSVGGNIVKNLVDGNWDDIDSRGQLFYIIGDILIIQPKYNTTEYLEIWIPYTGLVNHKYYYSICVNLLGNGRFEAGIMGLYYEGYSGGVIDASWNLISGINTLRQEAIDNNRVVFRVRSTLTEAGKGVGIFCKPLLIDLTEMYGAGNEPTKEECDRLFGTMDALPQGLTIANPTEFKSIGFNQFNPENVLVDKAIVDGAIVDGDKNIAVIPCLPCKVGVGENNGYCIHGDFGEDIKVYLTPLNPMEVEGELYMHELSKDATTDTYVPLIKGYMLVEVPTTANLCAHFLWSEDKCERDSYEPYFESKVELPVIPQMSEWGLAGIQSSGTLACDEIDFERGVYVKRIGSVDLGTMAWNMTTVKTPDETSTYSMFQSYSLDGIFLKPGVGKIANGMVEGYTPISSKTTATQEVGNMRIMLYNTGYLYLRDDAYASDDAFKTAMQGVMLYYELATPEEYPLPKVDNNYTSSDYGVEQFDSVVPCNANNLYYMRSLAGETRNFLDRLMAGLGTSDATVVADRILAVVNPAVVPANVEPEIPIEE